MSPWKVEVPAPKAANTPPESMSPDDSIAPADVVALPTPSPPLVPPVVWAPMKALPPTERAWAGVVVPIPRLPLSITLMASVSKPDFSVEKMRLDLPTLKFWVSKEVMADVVVGELPPPAPLSSYPRKVSRAAEVVAEE